MTARHPYFSRLQRALHAAEVAGPCMVIDRRRLDENLRLVKLSIPSALAIAFAIIAVGARAMLEGLRPQRETRRMQFYATAVGLASRRFDEARTHNKRIEAASLLERASYDEMVEYISSNERARFVL